MDMSTNRKLNKTTNTTTMLTTNVRTMITMKKMITIRENLKGLGFDV